VVAEWYVPDGATVAAGDLICRVECDVVAIDIEADAPGVLRQRSSAGSIEQADAIIGVITSPDEAAPSVEPAPGCAAAAPPGTSASELERHAGAVPVTGEPVVVPFRRGQREVTETVRPLLEAGTAIPGLPLWEPDEDPPFADAFRVPLTAGRLDRFDAIAAEVTAGAQVLTMEVWIDATQALRAAAALAEEWRGDEPPIVEDLVLRAFARALAENGQEPSPAGLSRVTPLSDYTVAISAAGERNLREAVRVRAAGGDTAADGAVWWLLSLRESGIDRGQPPLSAGHALAASMGAIGGRGWMSVTMAYDSARAGPGEAARILARVRRLVEEPYALLTS
jgi:pyruvate/2-oxoglutarate dehydrogenase complex dihydrolipoamide acyltransferase (E2) component